MSTADQAGDMWTNRAYFWVVECKNTRFHRRPNIFYTHRIPLGETDAYESRPHIEEPLLVRCDICGKEFRYEASDVLRYEMDEPESFAPHPVFRSQQF